MRQTRQFIYLFGAALFIPSCAKHASDDSSYSLEYAINRVFLHNDLDRNGCLSADEWQKMSDLAVNRLRNSEDIDNANELNSYFPSLFREFDKDYDGCVTKTEYIYTARRGIESNTVADIGHN